MPSGGLLEIALLSDDYKKDLKTALTNARFGWLTSVLCFALVVSIFFHETLFSHYSLVPTDILHHFLLPAGPDSKEIEVQNHYPIDQVTQTYPGEVYWQKSVKAGQVPLWNPYVFGGQPQLSNSIWGVLCPAKLLLLFCSPERAHSLGYILQFFLAGIFMMAFLRELGQSRWAAFLGACAYTFNTQFLMLYWIWMNVFAYVPLALFLFERSVRRNSWGYAVAAGGVVGVPLISGSIQMSFFVAFLGGFYGVASLWWRPAAERRQALRQLLAIVGIAALAGAIQFLPTLEFLPREAGGRIRNSDWCNIAGFRHMALGLPALLVFPFPALAGSPPTFDLMKVFHASMIDFTGYIGLVPFVLFAIGAQLKGEKRIRSLLLLIGIIMGVVFFTPLLRYVYHRFFSLAVFAMAVLAGYGFDAVLQASPQNLRKIQRTFTVLVGVGLFLAIALVVVHWYVQSHYTPILERANNFILSSMQNSVFCGYPDWLLSRVPRFLNHFRLSNPLFWVPLATLIGAWLCWLAYVRGKMNQLLFGAGISALAICDLVAFGRSVVPQVDLHKYPLYPPVEVLAKAQADPDLFRVYRWMPGSSMTLNNNVLTAYGLSVPGGYDSLFPENFNSFRSTNEIVEPVLDLENIKYVLTASSNTLPAGRFELAAEANQLRLYRNKTCMPRLSFVPKWQVVSDRRQILSLLRSGAVNPRETVLLEENIGQSEPQTSPPPNASVEVKQYADQNIVARVRTAQPGIILLADTWYPGWKARVDGQSTPLYRADYILKAIYVPAGDHEIQFYFAPPTFRIGAAISLLTILGAVLWGLWRGLLSKKAKAETEVAELQPSATIRNDAQRCATIKRVNVLGVGISAINLNMAREIFTDAIRNKVRGYVCVTGVHGIMEAQADEQLRKIHNQALLCTPDGMPMVWCGKLNGFSDMGRVYGPDLMLEICQLPGVRHFLFGGSDGAAKQLQQQLQQKFPNLQIVGIYEPPWRPLNQQEQAALARMVQEFKPDIMWVGLSTPKQERFMAEYLPKLDVALMVGVGAAFDLLSGRLPQAPRWIQCSGLEWFYRLCREPKRLWRRYLKNNPRFALAILGQALGLKKYSLD